MCKMFLNTELSISCGLSSKNHEVNTTIPNVHSFSLTIWPNLSQAKADHKDVSQAEEDDLHKNILGVEKT